MQICVVLKLTQAECWIFDSEEAAKSNYSTEKIIKKRIIDPNFDQTFKLILSTDQPNIERLKSLLNSIYFPGAKGQDVMIRRIEALDKEKTKWGSQTRSGLKLCDIACKCYYYADRGQLKRQHDEITNAFDIEMQRSKQAAFSIRLNEYGEFLKEKHKIPTKALGLLNFPQEAHYADASECYALCKIDPKTNRASRLSPCDSKSMLDLEINSIDLRKLKTTEEIHINGKQLDILGITWLKLLGIQQWCPQVENCVYEIYYPENSIDATIASAIELLSSTSEDMLIEIRKQNQYENDALSAARTDGKNAIIKKLNEQLPPEQIAELLNMELNEVNEILKQN